MRTVLIFCALAPLLAVGGCRLFHHEAEIQGRSPLRPMRASPESVTLEIIWVRVPLDDPQLNHEAWAEIDETRLTPAVRRELTNNGFRAGVISGTPPAAIVEALHMDAYRPQDDPGSSDPLQQSLDMLTDPVVHGHRQQLRRGRRVEVQASQVVDSVPLLIGRGRELGGRTYRDAQAIYALKVDPQPNRKVALELTPELHHGEPRVRWTGGDDGLGPLRMAPMREREVFDAMRMNVELAPGEMFVLTGLPEAGSRLGRFFHTAETSDGRQQKLVLVRLAQMPASDAFADSAAL
jgi:hypothetical protein